MRCTAFILIMRRRLLRSGLERRSMRRSCGMKRMTLREARKGESCSGTQRSLDMKLRKSVPTGKGVKSTNGSNSSDTPAESTNGSNGGQSEANGNGTPTPKTMDQEWVILEQNTQKHSTPTLKNLSPAPKVKITALQLAK